MTYYFPRLDRISYIEVTSPPFFGDFFTNPHSVLPILGFISQTHSNGFWKINHELRNMHNFTMRLSGFSFALKRAKWACVFGNFNDGIDQGPLICRNCEWFWFRPSVYQNQKGQGNCHQSEIIDRIQSEPKHNYWGARKNVQSVIFVPHCIFMHGNCQNDISNSPSPNYNYLMCRILGT